MDSLPTIHTIQASDAPQHSDKLREILQELETENRIKGFTTLGLDDDLSSITDKLKNDDLILIQLTHELEKKREQINKSISELKSDLPGLRIAEMLVDNLIYDSESIIYPVDLRPIRQGSDMDEAWSNIATSLRDEFPVKKKKKAKSFPTWILFVVLGVFLSGALFYYTVETTERGGDYKGEKTMTTVPDLSGMSGTEAISLLLDAGLEAREHRAESHETINKYLVIRSEPNAGEFIEEGAHVELIFSSGREQVQVPELTGMTLSEASSVLERAELRIGQQRSEHSNEFEQGRVIRTDPVNGSDVDIGSIITVVYSLGPPLLAAPSLAHPNDGAVFRPRPGSRTNEVILRWNDVNEAANYGVEWTALASGQDCSQINDNYILKKEQGISGTVCRIGYTLGLEESEKVICWRVYAVSTDDRDGHKSGWNEFFIRLD